MTSTCTILVIAQHSLFQMLQTSLAQAPAFHLLHCADSAQAIARLKQQPVQLVITDIDIGAIDGWRLTRLIRSGVLRCREQTPVILLDSTVSARITATTARAYGIDKVLPLSELEQLPALLPALLQQSAAPPTTPAKPRLLIVEDEADIAELARRILHSSYQIDVATTGPAALALFQQHRYMLVLLDVMLPGMSGEEVLKLLMQQQPAQSVVVMTAHGSSALAERMLLAGAADFISKPFRAEQLRKVLDVAAQREDFMVSHAEFAAQLQQLTDSEARYRQLSETHQRVLDHVSTVLMQLTDEGRICFVNRAWQQLSGDQMSPQGLLFARFLPAAEQAQFGRQLNNVVTGQQSHWRTEVMLALAEPVWVTLQLTGLPVGQPGVTLTLENISERKKAEQALEYLALHDPLTSLYNRYFFDEQLKRLAASADHHRPHALLYLDLDHFKVINDTHGHAQGDAVLRGVANRLRQCCADADLLCRVGGDEFVLLLPDCDLPRAQQQAQLLCQQLAQQHFQFNGRLNSISCSIGISLLDGSVADARTYLQQADIALYVAKNKGRNRAHCFSADDKASGDLQQSLLWAQRLREAIVREQIVLHFQPVVAIADTQVVYYEALVRLNLDEQLVYPGEFISALERVEDISLLDHQVICRAMAMMQQYPLLHKVAINLSAQAFADERLVPLVQQQLAAHQIKPERIIFELTETDSLQNIAATRDMINQLTALGCAFSIDDFGTGFSTFSYLKQLPACSIKIDGSFVKTMHQDQIDYALVKSMAEIARVLGRKSVAEFVENAEILQLLAGLGVDYAQGYHLCRPMPVSYFVAAAQAASEH